MDGFGRAPAPTNVADSTFQVVVESAPHALVLADAEGTITLVNTQTERLFKYTRAELIGSNIDRLVPERLGRSHKENRSRFTTQPSVRAMGAGRDLFAVRKDGSEVPVEIGLTPIATREGLFVLASIVDISTRKEMEAAQARLAAVVESSPDSISVCDFEGRVLSWNAGAEALYGYRADEIIGQSLRLVVPNTRQHELSDVLIAAARRGEAIRNLETERCRKDGSAFDALVTASPVLQDGKPVAFALHVRDVTASKQAERALRESETRFRTLADEAPVLIWVNSATGCEFVNRAYLDFLGVNPPDVTGYDWAAFIHPDDRDAYMAAYQHALQEESRFDALFRFRRADGEYRWMRSIGVPRRDTHGRRIGFIGSTADVTENVLAEQSAIEASRQKDEFIALLAHELRNPLAPIRTSVGVLRTRDVGDPVLVRCRNVIERQVAHMARLLDDLLDISRLSRGRLTLQRSPVLVRTVLEEAVEVSRPLIDQRGHTLALDSVADDVVVDGDPARLVQVFGNLLHNAAKYTDPGGHITLSVRATDTSVSIAVRDSGIGIHPDMLSHIFDLFVQGEPTIQRSREGLGIGLTLTRYLVELHGGVVEAHSAGPGYGSEFIVALPRVAARAPRQQPAGLGTSDLSLHGRRVLVVDDNADAADMTVTLVKMAGADVRVAYDGQTALQEAAAFQPDIVLLDIGLPDLSGLDVCRQLRASAHSAEAAILAITGWGQESNRRQSTLVGFDAHLVKPVDPSELLSLLRRISTTPSVPADGSDAPAV